MKYVRDQMGALEVVAKAPYQRLTVISLYRGESHVGDLTTTIARACWERLLERGDLEVYREERDVGRAPETFVVLTNQGRARLRRHRERQGKDMIFV